MGSDTLWGVFRAFSDLHRKMSDRRVCNSAGLIHTSENVCIRDASANSVSVPLYVAIIHLGRRTMSSYCYIELFTVQTSEYVCLHVFECSAHCGLISSPQTSKND